jgi:hypothetical protein
MVYVVCLSGDLTFSGRDNYWYFNNEKKAKEFFLKCLEDVESNADYFEEVISEAKAHLQHNSEMFLNVCGDGSLELYYKIEEDDIDTDDEEEDSDSKEDCDEEEDDNEDDDCSDDTEDDSDDEKEEDDKD